MVLQQTHFLRRALVRGAFVPVKHLFLLNYGLFLGFGLICFHACFIQGHRDACVFGRHLGGSIA